MEQQLQESVAKFRSYDFQNDKNWTNYLENFFPTPSIDKIQQLKRKYYKQIDPNFEIDFENVLLNNQQQRSNQQSGGQQQQQQKEQPRWIRIIYQIEGYLKQLYFLSLLTFNYFYCILLSGVICILAILRMCKMPQRTKEYGQKVLQNEFTMNLFYIICIYISNLYLNLILHLPLALHLGIGLATFMKMKRGWVYSQLKVHIDKLLLNREYLMYQKANWEVNQLFISFLFALFSTNIMSFFIYASFIRMKYLLSTNVQHVFSTLDYSITNTLTHPRMPTFITILYAKLKQFCRYLVKY